MIAQFSPYVGSNLPIMTFDNVYRVELEEWDDEGTVWVIWMFNNGHHARHVLSLDYYCFDYVDSLEERNDSD